MKVIGHRGAAGVAPENTLASFVAALHAGVDAVELDARLTSDGHVVVMHDDDVSRTTEGTGNVSMMTLEAVRALDAAHGFQGWSRREPVPTLEEVLDLVGGRTEIFLEVKGSFTSEGYTSPVPVVHAIEPMIAEIPDLTLSSFDPDAIREARAVFPERPTAIASLDLVEPDWALAIAVDGGHRACHVPEHQIDAEFVERAHAAGVEVFGWTVNDGQRAARLRAIGVDGIFTDVPGDVRVALAGT